LIIFGSQVFKMVVFSSENLGRGIWLHKGSCLSPTELVIGKLCDTTSE
jgi:hypothetical protein